MRSLLNCLIRVLILSLLVITGCDSSPSQPSVQSVKPSENSMIKIETNFGDIVLQLDAEKAPVTVQNFMDYLRAGFYDGTIFHRVIPGFMIQGGGLTAGLVEKTTNEPIKNEASNGLTNKRGSIAMARTPNPHSATSQFFINTVDNEFLNFQDASGQGWGYAVFGAVVKGMDVVDKISQAETSSQHGHQDVPAEVVTIKNISELTEAEVATDELTTESEA